MVETSSNQIELAQTSSFGDAVGQISTVKGGVFITHTDGTREPAQSGSPIYQGDQVETAAKGSVGIIFADDSTFSLADEGSMVIDEMVYDPSSQQGSSALSVAQGVFTFASGLIAKTDVDAMTITTPTATIGIRGTSGGGKAAPEGQPNTLSLFADADGNVGEMTVSNAVGSQVLSAPNQTTQITSSFSPPSKPVVMPPSVIQQFYSAAREALPPSPPPQQQDQAATGDQTAEQGANAEGGTEADAEALAEAEAQAEGTQGEAPPEGEPLPEGAVDPELAAAALAAADAAKQLAGGLGEGADAAIEGAATEAAQVALEDALGQGLSPQEAAQQAQAAALAAATAEARGAGISEAEIAAGAGAFEQAMAGGASLEDAFAAAMDAGGSAGEQAAVQFDTAVAQMQQQFGAGGFGAIGLGGPGPGSPDGPGPEGGGNDGGQDGTEGTQTGGFGDIGGFGGFGDIGGFGGLDGLGGFGDGGLLGGAGGDIFGPEFGPIYFEPLDIFVPPVIDGVLTLGISDNDDNPNTTSVFDDTIAHFTTGHDTFSGKDGPNDTTRFVMDYSVIGGNDVINGFGGTDEIAFTNLVTFAGSYDAAATGTSADPQIIYGSGKLSMTGIEQLFFSSAESGTKVRLGTDGDTSGVGFVLSGSGSLSTATGETIGTRVVSGTEANVLGSLIFGDSSANTMTGSVSGDIFYGGSGHDVMDAKEGDNNLYGGGDNDTFNVTTGNSTSSFDGGTGTDNVDYSGLATYANTYTLTSSSLTAQRTVSSVVYRDTATSVETLTGTNNGDTYNLVGGVPTGFSSITAGSAIDTFNITGSISATLDGGTGNNILNFTTLGGSVGSATNFHTINGNTGSDSVTLAAGGQTVTSVTGTIETFTGGSGTDAITLGAGGATLGNVSLIETIIDGGGTDSITLAAGGQTVTSVSGTIETFIGGSGTDSVTLAGTGVTLGNVSGIETIVGGGGADTVTLASGGVTVSNISLVETINGGSGADTITMSGATAATITGNGGNDTITGGSGADTFKWAATTDGIDQITLFSGSDKYDFSQLNIDGDGIGNVTALVAGTGNSYLEFGTDGAGADYSNADVIVFDSGTTYANAQTAFTTFQATVSGGDVPTGGAVLFLWDSSAGTDDVTLSIVYDSGSDGFGVGDFTDAMVLNDSGDSTLTIADVASGVDSTSFVI